MIEVIMRDTESGKVLYQGETKQAMLFAMRGETGCDIEAKGTANAMNLATMCMALDDAKHRVLRDYEEARKLYKRKEQIFKGKLVFDLNEIRNAARRDPGK